MVKDNMRQLKDRVVACTKCSLCNGRIHPTVGQGDHYAKVMFIGEAPGEQEDNTGIPFSGPAGRQLNLQLERIGLTRESIYVTNIVKCRPPNNRAPLQEEKDACSEYLLEQIDIIKPTVIVALGYHAAAFIFSLFGHEPSSKMGDMINKVMEPSNEWKMNCIVNGDTVLSNVKFMAILHPASILHNPYNTSNYVAGFDLLKTII